MLDDASAIAGDSDPEQDTLVGELSALIREELLSETSTYAGVFANAVAGLPLREVAARHGVTVQTVKSRFHRMRIRLRELVVAA